MPKFTMECVECETRYQTKKPISRRKCPQCGIMTTFIEVEKKPVILKGTPFFIMCLRCRRVHNVQSIPKQCSCGQRFQNHAENRTLTDVIFNAIVGSDKEKKGYMKVDVGRDGQVWWTPPKDEFGDDTIDPFIGDSARIRRPDVYTGRGITSRDDLRPVDRQETTTVRKKDFRS